MGTFTRLEILIKERIEELELYLKRLEISKGFGLIKEKVNATQALETNKMWLYYIDEYKKKMH